MKWRCGLLLLLFPTLFCLGCEEEPVEPPSYPFTFTVESDGFPMAGVTILVEGTALPETTNDDGLVRHRLLGAEGTQVRIEARCPDGFRSPAEPTVRTLRNVLGLNPSSRTRGIEVSFDCPPERRDLVIIVRTNDRAGLPLLLDGREIAQTDLSGTAHVFLNVPPGQSFRMQLATAESPLLRPTDPTYPFEVPDHDSVIVWEREFEEERPRRRRRRVRRPAPAPRLPVRIGFGR